MDYNNFNILKPIIKIDKLNDKYI